MNVTFSKPIDPSTFTDAALSLTLNGGANLITGEVTIALVSGSTYAISGLAGLDAADGNYMLTVNGGIISDLAGNAGTNSLATSWVMKTSTPAAPTNLAISPNTGVTPGLTDTGSRHAHRLARRDGPDGRRLRRDDRHRPGRGGGHRHLLLPGTQPAPGGDPA